MSATSVSSFRERAVRVRVPATSANLGPGFDTLGLALELYDEVEVRATGDGLHVEVEGAGADVVSSGADNLVVHAVRAAFDRMGIDCPGLAVSCINRIPHGRGLGSSAAAIVAGVCAARALVARETAAVALTDADVFALAAEIEGHPDNVAACLAGGLTVAWQDRGVSRWTRLEPDASLSPVAIVPGQALATEQARSVLPAWVAHGDASANAARAALLVTALTAQPELLFDATEDWLHQRYRAAAMPQTAELLEKLRAAGLPAVISGAGPTVLVLARADSAGSIGRGVGKDWQAHRLGVGRSGARTHVVTH